MRIALLACGLTIASCAHAGYPLITEDTATQGAGGWQLEAIAERETDHGTPLRTTNYNLALAYGLGEQLDLQAVLPWYRGGTQGAGDPELNLKWRFFERGPVSLGVKPAVTFPAGDAADGAGTGEATWAVTLIATYELGPLAINADLKYLRNRNTVGERASIGHGSMGLLYSLGPVRLVADYTRETPTDRAFGESARYRVLGVLWPISRELGLGFGWKRGSGGTTLEESWTVGAAVRW